MHTSDQKNVVYILFWAVLGPFILMAALFVNLVKGNPSPLYFSSVALVGLPMCWRWKMKGLLAALLLLGGALTLSLYEVPVQYRFWQVGMGITFALSFIVASLSFEEVEAAIANMQVESNSRLENLWAVDEKMKNLQERWQYDREDFNVRSKLMAQELEELKSAQAQQAVTLQAAKQDLEAVHLSKEKLLEELMTLRRENTQLEQKNCELSTAISAQAQPPPIILPTNSPETLSQVDSSPSAPSEEFRAQEQELRRLQGMYQQLREQFEDKGKVLAETRRQLFEKEGQLHSLQLSIEEQHRRAPRDLEERLEYMLTQAQNEVIEKEHEVHALNDLVSNLITEISELKPLIKA